MVIAAIDPILWSEAIITKWDASAALVAIVPDVWFDHAEQGATFPYCVFHEIDVVPDHIFGGASVENVRVQFSIFDDDGSHALISSAVAQLYLAFDSATLSLSDATRYTHMEMQRLSERPPRWAAENVWQADIDYRVRFFRTAS